MKVSLIITIGRNAPEWVLLKIVEDDRNRHARRVAESDCIRITIMVLLNS